MKKLYQKLDSYLVNFNTPDGEAGAGGTGAGGEAGVTPPEGGATGQASQSLDTTEPNWRDSIPAEHADNPRFKDAKSLGELLTAYASVNEAPVLPESLTLPEGVPQDIGAWGVEMKLDQDQFDGILNKYAAIETGRLESVKNANQAGFNALVESWGENAKANLALANRVIEFADPKGELKLAQFLKSPSSNYASLSPMIVTMFHNIGKAMAEGGALKGNNPPKNTSNKKVHYSHEVYPNQVPK